MDLYGLEVAQTQYDRQEGPNPFYEEPEIRKEGGGEDLFLQMICRNCSLIEQLENV